MDSDDDMYDDNDGGYDDYSDGGYDDDSGGGYEDACGGEDDGGGGYEDDGDACGDDIDGDACGDEGDGDACGDEDEGDACGDEDEGGACGDEEEALVDEHETESLDDDEDGDNFCGSDGENGDYENDDLDNVVAGEVSDNSGDYLVDLSPDQNEMVYLEFDGASKGNPGRAGGGAVIKSADGTVITRVSEGLGIDTNNGAEYKAVIQGLKTARDLGYDRIHVKGDSELVHRQVEGQWQTKNERMRSLCDKVKELKGQFKEFKTSHIPRGLNSDADAAANIGAKLPAGEIQREDNLNYRRRG